MTTTLTADPALAAQLRRGELSAGLTFMQRCLALCSRIPAGRVATYGTLAEAAGNPRAARAAGQAMASNPFAPDIPCHRVVASDGDLTGYSSVGGASRKLMLLKNEGVPVTDAGRVKREAFLGVDALTNATGGR